MRNRSLERRSGHGARRERSHPLAKDLETADSRDVRKGAEKATERGRKERFDHRFHDGLVVPVVPMLRLNPSYSTLSRYFFDFRGQNRGRQTRTSRSRKIFRPRGPTPTFARFQIRFPESLFFICRMPFVGLSRHFSLSILVVTRRSIL